ncbi:MAG: sensor histidine kinase, partial [Puniceicoccales bacterium]
LAYSLNRMIRNLRLYRNMTDERLNSTTHTFQTVLQRSPHSILFLTQEQRINYANPQADELLSSPEWADGIPSELTEIANRTLKGHNIYIQRQLHEAIQLKVNGQPRYFLVVSYPVELLKNIQDINTKNEPGVALTLQDITKMKLADDIKGNLVATVSHELKTPLTSARMALYLLAEQQIGTLNDDQLDLVDTAKEDLERQLATIQNLLDLSRAESNASELTKEACQANHIIDETVATHQDLSEACNVAVEVKHTEEDALIYADPHKVTIVLNNFLSNALRHSSHGSRVIIAAQADESEICFSVKDFGEGIEESVLPYIFERFRQGKNSTNVGSAGLGLHIAKQIIEQHGGEIGCTSQKGEGSEFYFRLPRHIND